MLMSNFFFNGRLHDNPSLTEACQRADRVYPIFVLDPWFARPEVVGINRYHFLLKTLTNLDSNLRAIGSRLYIIRGNPEEVIPLIVNQWNVDLVTFEKDTEPYAIKRDTHICSTLRSQGVTISSISSHTIFSMEKYIAASKGYFPSSYQSFLKLFSSLGSPRTPIAAVSFGQIPPSPADDLTCTQYDVPTLNEMGYFGEYSDKFPGGETEALRRLADTVQHCPVWVAGFQKPETSPNSIEPSTTVLSPYIKFGCLSSSLFYYELDKIYKARSHTMPPVSLHGQLLWRGKSSVIPYLNSCVCDIFLLLRIRCFFCYYYYFLLNFFIVNISFSSYIKNLEFFYLSGTVTPNFDKMDGNPKCKQIPWSHNIEFQNAFKEARTGYPYIDAIMTQLKTEGWIHHLARHSLACFFTRGDLWQSWQAGAEIFDLYLLDSDWALNNANWQWLSCSNFFYQYFRCYSPIAFGKKTDKEGAYIKKYIPKLARYPAKYIYEPWTAPRNLQKDWGCVIGTDYPNPIVDHSVASAQNMEKMKAAYHQSGFHVEGDMKEGSLTMKKRSGEGEAHTKGTEKKHK